MAPTGPIKNVAIVGVSYPVSCRIIWHATNNL